MTVQGQQHLMTNILVDWKVKRVGVKPTELGMAICYQKKPKNNRAEQETPSERADNSRKQ